MLDIDSLYDLPRMTHVHVGADVGVSQGLTYTRTHTDTHRHTQTHRHTDTQTHRHTHTNTRKTDTPKMRGRAIRTDHRTAKLVGRHTTHNNGTPEHLKIWHDVILCNTELGGAAAEAVACKSGHRARGTRAVRGRERGAPSDWATCLGLSNP